MASIERSDGDRSLAAAVPETRDPAPAQLEPAGVTPSRSRRLGRRTWLGAVAGVLVLPILVAAGLSWSAAGASTTDPSNAAAARVVSPADMEREYGIKVDLVGVTAAGGLVDLRFTIVDKDKAAHVFHDKASMPELLVEQSGAVLTTNKGMSHTLTLLDGAKYFVLYSNSGGAVQPGTPVSVVIGDVRLEPLSAQS